MDWLGLHEVVVECLMEGMRIPLDSVKDLELFLDIPSGQYAVRFIAIGDKADLTEDAYAAEVRWSVQQGDSLIKNNLVFYPWEYVGKDNYTIFTDAEILSLAEVEALIMDKI